MPRSQATGEWSWATARVYADLYELSRDLLFDSIGRALIITLPFIYSYVPPEMQVSLVESLP